MLGNDLQQRRFALSKLRRHFVLEAEVERASDQLLPKSVGVAELSQKLQCADQIGRRSLRVQ